MGGVENLFVKCTMCGRNGATVIDNGKFFCSECVKLFNTCATCIHSKKCDFESNPAPIPKVVAKRLRQETQMGYMEQIQHIPNPQRIKAFCLEGQCVCCDHKENPHCMRQFGLCENYKEIEF